jgi:hypothetical protein
MIELIVVLGAFWVFWRYFSRDPPPNSTSLEMTPIAFSWIDDDSFDDNVDVSQSPRDRKESEELVQKDDCFQVSLSAPRIQHFPDATLKS